MFCVIPLKISPYLTPLVAPQSTIEKLRVSSRPRAAPTTAPILVSPDWNFVKNLFNFNKNASGQQIRDGPELCAPGRALTPSARPSAPARRSTCSVGNYGVCTELFGVKHKLLGGEGSRPYTRLPPSPPPRRRAPGPTHNFIIRGDFIATS